MYVAPTPSAVRRLRFDEPLDVRATLGPLAAGRRDPCHRRAADGVWRATNTPDGPATLQIDDRRARAHDGGGVVDVRAWGAGADWAVAHVDELLGAHDRPDDFAPDDPDIAELHRRHRGLRFCRSRALTEALVPTILGQKVQTTAAMRSWRRIVWTYGAPAPGPVAGLRLPPTPARLAGLGYEAFHRFDVERKRAETILRVCRRAAGIDALVAAPAATVQSRLQSLPGIGAWTTASVVQVALGDPDAIVVGDFHLPHAVTWHLAGEPRGTDARMLELLAPYAGHRARVQRLVVRLGPAPRYGPRLARVEISDR